MLSKRVKSFFNLILGVSGSSADSEEPLEPCSLGASQASSRLLNLPFELIHKILFSYHYSSRDYCVLRLVCSGLNGLVKHRIAGHLRLPNKTASEAKWETLTSRRKSVFSTATHTLYLKGFEEDRRKQVGCRAYSFNAALHNAQMKYLCASIAVLKRVKTVHWTISTRLKMNHDILKCLTQLPHLENIHFAVDRNPKVRQMQYPWGLVIGHSFLNLKSVSLDIYSRDQVTGFQGFGVDAMSSDIHLFLSAHPTLESLDLTGPPHANVDFSDILQDIPTKEGFRASITSLRLRDMNLDATPGVLLYLSQLTSLDISNKADLDKGKIWVGLRDARVKLQVLKVSHIPQSLLSYLSSYTGLREFHGIVWHRPDSDLRIPPKRTDVEARDRLFQTVLPFHRDSLEAICVSAPLYSDNEEDARYWCATETQMMQLQRFPGLKALGLAYLLEWDHDGKPTVKPGSLTMTDVLVGIILHPSSEKLRTLQLSPVTTQRHRNAFGAPVYPNLQLQAFDHYIATIGRLKFDPADITVARAGTPLDLILYGRRWPMVCEPALSGRLAAWRFDIPGAWPEEAYWADLEEKLSDCHILYLPLEE